MAWYFFERHGGMFLLRFWLDTANNKRWLARQSPSSTPVFGAPIFEYPINCIPSTTPKAMSTWMIEEEAMTSTILIVFLIVIVLRTFAYQHNISASKKKSSTVSTLGTCPQCGEIYAKDYSNFRISTTHDNMFGYTVPLYRRNLNGFIFNLAGVQ